MLETQDLEVGCVYAVLLRTPLDRWQTGGVRPLKAEWDGAIMRVQDPDNLAHEWIMRSNAVGLTILGRWDSKPHPSYGNVYSKMTWQGVAAYAHGQILKQRELAKRLTAVGIERDPEPYIVSDDTAPALRRDLRLTHSELEFLLDRAGV